MEARQENQNSLALRSGVSQPTIFRILTGESTEPRRSNVEKLARALGVSIDDLYARDTLQSDKLPPRPRQVPADTPKTICVDDLFAALEALLQLEQVPKPLLKTVTDTTKSRLVLELRSIGVGVRPLPNSRPDNWTTPNTGEPDGFRSYSIDEPLYVAPILTEDIEKEQDQHNQKKA